MTASGDSLTRPERLDRLPFTRQHRKLLVGSGIGWALDAMDVGLISFIMTALAVQWGLSLDTLSWVASIGFLGMAVGATLGGLLADRIGRRQVFAATLLVYGIATGVSALAWSVGALIVLRFVIGLGLGAELPVASTLVSEYAPARIRGRVVVALEAFWAVGWLAAAVIGYYVVGGSDDGWRWAFLVGVVPALYSVVVRRRLPESVRFLERAGRTEEAEAAVRSYERAAGVAPVPSPPAPPEPKASPAELWQPRMRRRTAALWAVWFGINFSYYGAFTWIPTLLVADGFPLVRSFGYTLVITLAQLPGYAAAAYLVERWGRRQTLTTFLLGSGVAAGLFGAAGGASAIVASGMLLSFFNLGAWGALYAATPEAYPTRLRATGAGAAAGFGRIASILAPLAVPPLREAGGNGLVFAVFAVFFLLAAGASWLLPERRGTRLEDAEAGAGAPLPARAR
ncbi:MFS transporter [Motilibacter aurantiacus]|uniref:MFS transporter n=1 Tax=Motilibacter aurantiacus TaxID=2714955 RepID=UPI0014082E74|nr:MFS transporter [Motilibacter aurantiacus]NHC43743.1 MFS transporter [Motilibacter aurantiacus]